MLKTIVGIKTDQLTAHWNKNSLSIVGRDVVSKACVCIYK